MDQGVADDDRPMAGMNRKPSPVGASTSPDWVMLARQYLTLVLISLFLSSCHLAGSEQCFATDTTNDLEAWSGTIRSANFGLVAYPNNEDCRWVIRLSLGSRISLQFNHFDLEPPGNICFDYIEIFDGGNTNAQSVGQFCGTTPPEDILSSGHELTVVFHSDNTQGFPGFEMQYTGVCSAVSFPLEADETITIESPLYPAAPPSQPACSWSLEAPEGHYVEAEFTDFQQSSDSCDDTAIEVYDGEVSPSGVLMTVCPDATAPPKLVSTSNTLIVVFGSSQSTTFLFSIRGSARVLPCSSNPCLYGGSCSNNLQLTPPIYQCTCAVAYTGAQCETEINECAPISPCSDNAQDCIDHVGSFECVCSSGFTGVLCETDIDECSRPDVCSNGGICINTEGSFECQCAGGFTGQFCETDINECDEYPCQNGGSCTNEQGSFSCQCTGGFDGDTCEQDINECDGSPCQNGGSCTNEQGSFSCQCAGGFEGDTCEQDINECDESPCQNGGSCTNEQGSFSCQCAGGFEGDTCEQDINECNEYPCQNGGSCTNQQGSFSCQCAAGFEGDICEQDVNECDANPCQNGGTCTNQRGSFSCYCDLGFEGLTCNQDIDECSQSPTICQNGGQCINSEGSYRCQCLASFTGTHCQEDVDECSSNPCVNGTCSNSFGSYLCLCADGFEGKNCDSDVNECFLAPCLNWATCVNTPGSYYCHCTEAYTGKTCNKDANECELEPCLNGGSCINTIGSYRCECPLSLTGNNCEVDVDECLISPCQNGGSCTNNFGSYTCTCPSSYFGNNCLGDVNECDADPCFNNGTCVNLVGSYRCECYPQFTGQLCEDDADECHALPCNNGGICTNTFGSYTCECTPYYTGQNCEIDIDECESSPCLNWGSCSNSVGSYACTCTLSYRGRHCDEDVNECEINPCLNGGNCSNSVGSYHCECHRSYTGRHCGDDVNECENNPCRNGGTCSNFHGSFHCQCSDLFSGSLCEEDVNECLNTPCGNGGTCLNLHGDFSCTCPDTMTGKTCESDVDECAIHTPCENGATCINEDGGYSCACAPGFQGDTCSQDVDECTLTTPCLNKARCINIFGSYSCECGRNFTGKNCAIDINECIAEPCRNGGSCINTYGGFACVCAGGFRGTFCNEDVNECDIPGGCQHRSTCINTEGSFRCDCADGYQGPLCEVDIDDCAESPCINGGACVDGIDSFTCVCLQGYYGERCEIVVSENIKDCEEGLDSISRLYWNRTTAGKTAETACPQGTTGIASRVCSALTDVTPPLSSWDTPDLSQCINPNFLTVTEKLDELEKRPNITVDDVIGLASLLSNLTSSSKKNQSSTDANELHIVPQDIMITTKALSAVADLSAEIAKNLTVKDIDDLTNAFVDTVDHILDDANLGAWKTSDDTDIVTQQLTSVVASSENMALSMAQARRARSRLDQGKDSAPHAANQSLSFNKTNIEFDVIFVADSVDDERVKRTFVRSGGSLSIPPEVFQIANQQSDDSDQLAIYRARYPSLASLYSALEDESISRINTDVMATKILGVDEAFFGELTEPVVGIYKHQEIGANLNPSCVFLDLDQNSGVQSDIWKATGCKVYASNRTHTTCHCNHLTNFAVIMDVHGVQDSLSNGHGTALSILSQIGGSMSIVGCVTSVAVYEFFRLKSDRIRVHENLGVAIAISQFIFLVGMERTDIMWLCKAVAITFHYSITAMFCWMLLEGVHLYVMLVKVFGSGSNVKKYLLAGWGIPLVVAGVSAGVFYKEYAVGNVCWMSTRAMLFSFIPTVAIVIMVNTAFLIMVLHVMMRSMSAKYKSRVSSNTSQVKAGLKAAAILLPLLGLTWVFGFLSVNARTLVFTYLFAILNSFQGLFFFIAHCILNMEVRKAYERRYGKTKAGMISSTALSSVSNTASGKGGNRNISGKSKSTSGSSSKSNANDTVALCRKSSDDSQGMDCHDNPVKTSSVDETNHLNNGLSTNQDSTKKKLSPDGPLQHNEIQCLVKDSEKNINQGKQNGGLSKEAKVAMENMISKSNVASNNENIA
ncbi:protein eyes shut homolog isoform X1 [Lytechinus pictus]|uniref:protein eyes shut homolog isoform X1 n=2 Tax=Lytechinus pictus TaxID=7653 RepID=UPI0030B9F72F